jgi:hypothetical protein
MTSHRLVFVMLSLVPSIARADSSAAQAEVLFDRGRALVQAGKLAEGCAAFDASQKLDPATSTLVNLADCREKNQQYATAWGTYLEVAHDLRGDTEQSTVQLRDLAAQRAAALAPRLSKVTIQVPPSSRIAGLEIQRDTAVVEPGAWDQSLPQDGGTYRISARAPGHREWTTTITVGAEHDAQTVTVPVLDSTPDAPAAPVGPAVLSHAPAPRPHAGVSRPRPIVALAVGGGAVVLGGGALAFELSARSVYADAKAAHDRASQVDLWDSANRRRWVAGGLGVAAAAGAGVAVCLYVRHRRHEVAIAPVLTGADAGLSIGGAW